MLLAEETEEESADAREFAFIGRGFLPPLGCGRGLARGQGDGVGPTAPGGTSASWIKCLVKASTNWKAR